MSGFPVTALSDADGPVEATRGARVGDPEIRLLLRRRDPVQFVVADGTDRPLHWVPIADAPTFWMTEVRPRIVPVGTAPFDPDSYPGRYCYVGSVWTRPAPDAPPLVLLERHR